MFGLTLNIVLCVSYSVALAFFKKQLQTARELFSLGAIVDSRHGPLYHAHGNMEMVRAALPLTLIH